MSIELPPPPVKGADEPLAEFQIRHLAWWREGDIKLRTACHDMKVDFFAAIEPNIGPSLTRIADAWDAFDVRLGELTQALQGQNGTAATGDGARVAMAALMTEGGADKPPAEVAQAVLARVAAVDTMLGGEASGG